MERSMDIQDEQIREKERLVGILIHSANDGAVFCTYLLLYYLYDRNEFYRLEWYVQGYELCRAKELLEDAQ